MLDKQARAEVVALAAAIEDEDGAPPLSDQALSQLGSTEVQHLLARDDGLVSGYGQLDGDSFEVAARLPALDGLLDDAAAASTGAMRVWSHGRGSRLVPVLEHRGLQRVRELHQLRRPLHDLPPDPPLQDGLAVRAFEPGADDDAWLALNAAAFAHHAEQGRFKTRDLTARMAESWFDPAGFLLAERDRELLGFHWTKVHPDGLGEVYVLGVAPAAQGLGLGRALLIRGLRRLRARGCATVLLYVDGDNPAAMHLYERDGFTRYDLDIQWQTP